MRVYNTEVPTMEGIKFADGSKVWNGATYRALVLDLDGTIRRSKRGEDQFIMGPSDIELYDGIEEKIESYKANYYLVFGVSNQGGVSYGHKTFQQCEAELDATLELFENKSLFDIVKQCYHMAGGSVFPYNMPSIFRKPNSGMLAEIETDCYAAGKVVDWGNSLFVGDREEDRQCAVICNIPFMWAKEFRIS